ncbi:maestro heat-like repeat family member 5, partial [Sceloporus undulatus]|uniref:maestro heat-like repeat family member 5 n=1 Tax=Sceloporus undulatus TaxID=8520 RepID=UPI001C4D8D25
MERISPCVRGQRGSPRLDPTCIPVCFLLLLLSPQERAIVRYRAFTLLGELVRGVSEADKVLMKREVVFSLLPLLLHLMDQDSTVSTSCRLTLLDCGLFFGWTELPLIFRSLAWEDLQSCLYNIWKYLMGNHSDSAHVFLSQALQYLHHPQTEIKHAAAEFT